MRSCSHQHTPNEATIAALVSIEDGDFETFRDVDDLLRNIDIDEEEIRDVGVDEE